MNNNYLETAAGFGWRSADGTPKRGNWLRDLAIGLAVALAASLLLMVADAHAQDRVIQISGNTKTAMVTVAIGKRAFYSQLEQPLSVAYAEAAEVMVRNMIERDAEEGIGAFIEKRDPKWSE